MTETAEKPATLNRAQRRARARDDVLTRDGEEFRVLVHKRGVMRRIIVDENGQKHYHSEHPRSKTKKSAHDKRIARARDSRQQWLELERAKDRWDVTFSGPRGGRLGTLRVQAKSVRAAKLAAWEARPKGTRTFRVLPYCEVA